MSSPSSGVSTWPDVSAIPSVPVRGTPAVLNGSTDCVGGPASRCSRTSAGSSPARSRRSSRSHWMAQSLSLSDSSGSRPSSSAAEISRLMYPSRLIGLPPLRVLRRNGVGARSHLHDHGGSTLADTGAETAPVVALLQRVLDDRTLHQLEAACRRI